MKATIRGVRIRGICAAVPKETHKFENEIKDFPFSGKKFHPAWPRDGFQGASHS